MNRIVATSALMMLAVSAASPNLRAEPTVVPVEPWLINKSTSPVDDSAQVQAEITSSEGNRAKFIIRCDERRTQAILYLQDRYRRNYARKGLQVITRIDRETATEMRWRTASDDRALFSPAPGTLIRALPDHGILFARIKEGNGNSFDLRFRHKGTIEVRAAIAAACRWQQHAPK